VLESLENKSKLDTDFDKFNLAIERATEVEMNRLHDEINALKDKATKMSEELLSPLYDDAKGN
jgi:hypothetical protein